ncbi:MAG: hypothetical protein PHN69_03625 [Candidatus Pacebacteria bacterium]|nr:hypothetical protein [Fermentimonas sp.]MDD4804240.1 hypothetical protein [Candidatus Paceibacterota bacterium]
MFNSTKRFLKKIARIDPKNTSQNIGGSTISSPQIPEPTILPQDEPIAPLYKEEELKKELYESIFECYPDIKNLNINIVSTKIYIGNGRYDDKYYLNVTWENGVSECRINSIVNCILTDYLDDARGNVNKSMIRPQLIRMFTEEVILQVSQKYANCIAQNLPINMHNIHCFKVGEVPIYDLAIGELRLMNEVK